jgi:pimeloyl-ACP methyl ester carboxylesterase
MILRIARRRLDQPFSPSGDTMKRWAKYIAIALACSAAVLLVTGAGYEAVMRSRTEHAYPVPGRLVDIGGRRLQVDCRGSGTPTVVFESGLDHLGSLSWTAVHDSIARTTRACAYSRAGIMWSDPAPGSFDAGRVARDLHAALAAAGERSPWIVVGHSMGGPYVTLFTQAYPTEVAGLVLVDASHPAQFARYQEATGRSLKPTSGLLRVGSTLAWTGLVRFASEGGAPANWPERAVTVPEAYLPRSIHALRAETDAIDSTLAAVERTHSLGDRPLVVVTGAAEMSPERLAREGVTQAEGGRMHEAWVKLQEEESHWSSDGRHEPVSDASHYVQFDRPDVVIAAVREVIAETRALLVRR